MTTKKTKTASGESKEPQQSPPHRMDSTPESPPETDEESLETQEEAEGSGGQSPLQRLSDLVIRAKRGDRSVLPGLRRVLDENPFLWKGPGNLALVAQSSWIKLIAGEDLHLREVLARHVNALKGKLANSKTPPLENLLVERVIATWLRIWYIEAHDAEHEEKSLKWSEFQLKRLQVAHNLHEKAIAALLTYKKLLGPEPAPIKEVTQTKPKTAKANGKNNGHISHRTNGDQSQIPHNRLAELLPIGDSN